MELFLIDDLQQNLRHSEAVLSLLMTQELPSDIRNALDLVVNLNEQGQQLLKQSPALVPFSPLSEALPGAAAKQPA